jgi:hypothetical protein
MNTAFGLPSADGLTYRSQVPAPHRLRLRRITLLHALEEGRSQFRVFLQKRPRRLAALQRVAAPAARYQVARRPIAAAHARLHMVQRQLVRRKYLTTIYTTIPVTE